MYQFKHRCAAGDNGAKSGTDCADALRDSSSALESAHNVFSNSFNLAERAERSERVLSRSRVPICRIRLHDDVGGKNGRHTCMQTMYAAVGFGCRMRVRCAASVVPALAMLWQWTYSS